MISTWVRLVPIHISESTYIVCVFKLNVPNTWHAGKHRPTGNGKVNLEKLPPAPFINTRMGNIRKEKGGKVIPEIKEHSFYIMQTIRIGSTDTLVFFDRGSNTHNIKARLQ